MPQTSYAVLPPVVRCLFVISTARSEGALAARLLGPRGRSPHPCSSFQRSTFNLLFPARLLGLQGRSSNSCSSFQRSTFNNLLSTRLLGVQGRSPHFYSSSKHLAFTILLVHFLDVRKRSLPITHLSIQRVIYPLQKVPLVSGQLSLSAQDALCLLCLLGVQYSLPSLYLFDFQAPSTRSRPCLRCLDRDYTAFTYS